MASAETLNCPMCGAASSSDAHLCAHCGARLAAVACPSCFGMIFAGAKYCSHCGANIAAVQSAADQALCPRCSVPMNVITLGSTELRECPKCEGTWVDAETLRQICADREKQSAILGCAAPLPEAGTVELEQQIRYIPCPICRQLMNRVNFARFSHVVVDVCSVHGTWFDRDELRRIIEFIRAGGLEQARQRQIEELKDEERAAESARTVPVIDYTRGGYDENWHSSFSTIASALVDLFGG